jgi:hypothetical protein
MAPKQKNKGGRPKKKPIKREDRMMQIADEMMASKDHKERKEGVNLAIKIQEKIPQDKGTVVNPMVFSFFEMCQRLVQDTGLTGDEVFEQINEQISDVEQLIRRKVS